MKLKMHPISILVKEHCKVYYNIYNLNPHLSSLRGGQGESSFVNIYWINKDELLFRDEDE